MIVLSPRPKQRCLVARSSKCIAKSVRVLAPCWGRCRVDEKHLFSKFIGHAQFSGVCSSDSLESASSSSQHLRHSALASESNDWPCGGSAKSLGRCSRIRHCIALEGAASAVCCAGAVPASVARTRMQDIQLLLGKDLPHRSRQVRSRAACCYALRATFRSLPLCSPIRDEFRYA